MIGKLSIIGMCYIESWVEVGGAVPQEVTGQEELEDLIADAAKEDPRHK